jgi:PAS domain S-box-containing protein
MGTAGADPSAQESELAARLAAIVESSGDAILSKTLDGVITSWNGGAARMYGYRPEEIIGQNVAVLIPPGQRAELGPILDRLRRGERVGPFETKRRRKDGTIVDVSVCISPIRNQQGTVTGASAVARDVTERNLAEARHRSLEQELRRSDRLETLGQLAGGIAHDFNNLLAAITNYASFIAEATAARPRVQADAVQIQAVASRGARLARQLLIFGRQEPDEPALVDLNTLLSDTQELLRTSLGGHIEVRVTPADQPALVLADRPPRRAARAPASACPPCTASSPRRAAASPWTAPRGTAARSRSTCPPARRRRRISALRRRRGAERPGTPPRPAVSGGRPS